MHNLRLIISREYLARVRNKTFIVMTFLSPIIMVIMIFAVTFLSNLNNSKTSTVAVHDESGSFIEQFQNTENVIYKDLSDLSLERAIDSSQSEDYTGIVVIPKSSLTATNPDIRFLTNNSPDANLISDIEHKLSQIFTEQKLVQQNIDLESIAKAQTTIDLKIKNFSGQQTSKMSNAIKSIFGGGVGYLLMMFIIIYGNMVMRSVIEEKTNRIIEIIVSSVKPIYLMLGKILGNSLAGITQFLIWIIVGLLLLVIAGSWFDLDLMNISQSAPPGLDSSTSLIEEVLIDIANLPLLKLTFFFLVYFISGFFLYSAIYAAIGAAVDSETDTQQFILPITFPLMLGFFVGFFSVMGNPDGIMPVIFSYIPFTSPIVMLMRIPFGVAWWELLISIIILIGSIIAAAWVGAKIYRVGILMYGKKPSYKKLIKWLKY